MGADPAGLAVAALVSCAATIPDSVKIKVKQHDDWTESARRPHCAKRFRMGGFLGGQVCKNAVLSSKFKGLWWSRGGSNP
jgi:hypothetical protein